jgi:hypothetical protein
MRKSRSLTLATMALSCLGYFAMTHAAFADESELEIDSRFRAKIIKEKVKQTARQNEATKNGNLSDTTCGSQNIGNIDTGGRVGAAPREVFVFAPNAVNVVSGRGCK